MAWRPSNCSMLCNLERSSRASCATIGGHLNSCGTPHFGKEHFCLDMSRASLLQRFDLHSLNIFVHEQDHSEPASLLTTSRSQRLLRTYQSSCEQVLDARHLPFEAESFDVIIDKGTLDSMLCDQEGKGSAR